MAALQTSGRSEIDVLKSIQSKSIEEVMVSRKANCVLGQQGGELVTAAAALSAGRSKPTAH